MKKIVRFVEIRICKRILARMIATGDYSAARHYLDYVQLIDR